MKYKIILIAIIFFLLLTATLLGQNPNFSYPYNFSKKAFVSRQQIISKVFILIFLLTLSTKPFEKKPKVVIMPSLLDAEKATQIRYSIRATGISRDGFVLLAEVWGDTQLNSVGGFWLAHTEE
jgi:hypothetical protein